MFERWVLNLLVVPPEPERPDGSPASIRVFRAGQNYYLWSVLEWAIRCAAFLAVLTSVTFAVGLNLWKANEWVRIVVTALFALGWIVFGVGAIVTLIGRRLSYRLHWYIVTDRSLRIRRGVFQVNELTITYGNIQEIRVSAGPLQKVLGLADVEVQTAGGGGDQKQRSDGHTGRFEGLSNADAIRDLIQDRLRQYRDSGLGDAPRHAATPAPADEIAAARTLLDEARALRAALRV